MFSYLAAVYLATGLLCIQPLGRCVFSHWAGVCSATGLVCVQPLGWCVFSHWTDVCIQSPDWYGVSYGYFITCICAVFNMQKILPCRYLELRSVASTDQLRGPRAVSPGRSSASHSRDNYNFFGMAGQDVRGYMSLPRHVFKMAGHFLKVCI